MQCSATADLSGCASLICLLCSVILREMARPLCPMYTFPHAGDDVDPGGL
jgi:hypothetical protein